MISPPAAAMQPPDSTVYLVDSSIYVYRAWHLTPKSINDPAGQQVNAVHGFAEFMLQIVSLSGARYLVCAFDHASRPTVRQKIYPDYKSGRSATPPLLRRQFPLCQELAKLMGICEISIPAYEADDIIDTLAKHCRKDNKQVCVISADKDLTQCIRDGDIFWDYARKNRLDKRGIEKRFGVKPEQIADLLALSGDKVDSIPGVPGIGPATAARLLKKWGNIDILFDHLEQAGQMKFRGAKATAALLAENQQLVRQSRKISGLFHIDQLAQNSPNLGRSPVDTTALNTFLDTNGFEMEQQQRILSAANPP